MKETILVLWEVMQGGGPNTAARKILNSELEYAARVARESAEAENAQLRERVAALEAALRAIQQWDCLNPPNPQLLSDLPWLRKLVDAALLEDAKPAALERDQTDLGASDDRPLGPDHPVYRGN